MTFGFEEGNTGRQDHLVIAYLTIVLGGQGRIRQVCVKPELFKGYKWPGHTIPLWTGGALKIWIFFGEKIRFHLKIGKILT